MTAPGFRGRGVVAAAVTLLVVMFPALMAGAWIDQPVRAEEVTRLRQAIADPKGEAAGPAALFYGALLPADADTLDEAGLRQQVAVSRLGSVLGMFVLSALLYLAVAGARGRGRAALACIALGCLPPIAREGSVLRPEVPTAVFGLLAVLILTGMPAQLAGGRRKSCAAAWAVVLAVAMAVATAFGLSIACLPIYGIELLVPAGCLLVIVLLQGQLLIRVLRRTQMMVLPFRAFTLRLLPWLLIAFLSIMMTALILDISTSADKSSPSPFGLLPAAWWLAWPTVAVAVLGAVVWGLGVGLEVGRRRRPNAGTVLAIWVLVMLVHRLEFAPGADALPAAPALAVLLAEGARIVLLLAGNQVLNRRT